MIGIKADSEENEQKPIDSDYAAAIAELREYMETSGKTQSDIAKDIGRVKGLVSAFLGGKYTSPDTIIPLVREAIEKGKKRETAPEPPAYAETSVSRKVRKLIEYCYIQGKIGIAYGDAGIGKTEAVKKYCADNLNAIMVTSTVVHSGVKGITRLLARKLGCKQGGTADMFDDICEKLSGARRVIIIDEAQLLTVLAINHLRAITDACGVGIAFVGNEEIYQKMHGKGEEKYAQLFSRIGYKVRLRASQISEKDISAVFGGRGISREAIGILYKISKCTVGLRGAVNVYLNAALGRDAGEISAREISEMARDMGFGQVNLSN
jgi:DNA transposition AAA+ family ATPase